MTWTSLMNSICNQCFLPLTSGYISNSSERSTPCQRNKTLVTYRIHQGGPHHVNGRKHWLHIEFIREVHIMSTEENRCGPPWWIHIMSTEENTGYISNSSERSTSCQRKKTDVDLPDEFTSCQRKKTLATYRFHQRGPHHVNGRKHWLHIEFIREVHVMPTEENTGYISNSTERSNSCQRKKTGVDLSDEIDM